MNKKDWKKVFEHNNDPIKEFEIDGVKYLGTFGVFRKIDNGKVFDMDPVTKKWNFIKELSLSEEQYCRR